jgi:hypothetical protein
MQSYRIYFTVAGRNMRPLFIREKFVEFQNTMDIIIWVAVNLMFLYWCNLIIERFKIDPLFVYGIYSVIVYWFFSYIRKKE